MEAFLTVYNLASKLPIFVTCLFAYGVCSQAHGDDKICSDLLVKTVGVLTSPRGTLITVERSDGSDWPTQYIRTNRDLEKVAKFYPSEMLKPIELQGKQVLDAPCGEGAFVKELRAKGISAKGLDISLSDGIKASPEEFIEADMANTSLPAESIDIFYSTFGPLWFEIKNRPLTAAILEEAHRILRVGGVLRLSPLVMNSNLSEKEQETEKQEYIKILDQRDDLKVVDVQKTQSPNMLAVEMKRIR
jgi:SAM-dependent methyltransferase